MNVDWHRVKSLDRRSVSFKGYINAFFAFISCRFEIQSFLWHAELLNCNSFHSQMTVSLNDCQIKFMIKNNCWEIKTFIRILNYETFYISAIARFGESNRKSQFSNIVHKKLFDSFRMSLLIVKNYELLVRKVIYQSFSLAVWNVFPLIISSMPFVNQTTSFAITRYNRNVLRVNFPC